MDNTSYYEFDTSFVFKNISHTKWFINTFSYFQLWYINNQLTNIFINLMIINYSYVVTTSRYL